MAKCDHVITLENGYDYCEKDGVPVGTVTLCEDHGGAY